MKFHSLYLFFCCCCIELQWYSVTLLQIAAFLLPTIQLIHADLIHVWKLKNTDVERERKKINRLVNVQEIEIFKWNDSFSDLSIADMNLWNMKKIIPKKNKGFLFKFSKYFFLYTFFFSIWNKFYIENATEIKDFFYCVHSLVMNAYIARESLPNRLNRKVLKASSGVICC